MDRMNTHNSPYELRVGDYYFKSLEAMDHKISRIGSSWLPNIPGYSEFYAEDSLVMT